jgi:hypothetical protein
VLIGWLLGESFFSHIQTSMSEMLRVPSDSLQIGNGTPLGLSPDLEHFDNVSRSARADPKPDWFGVIDMLLCLDVLKCYVHLLHLSSGRCCLCELIEFLEVYVL